jgi:elongation factor 3
MPTKMNTEEFKNLIENLYTCESSGECLVIATKLGEAVKETGLVCLSTNKILDQLMEAANNKKSGLEREGGLLGIAGIAKVVGKPIVPYLLPLVPAILDLESDKGLPVREAAHLAISNIFENVPSHGIPFALGFLLEGTNGKWQTKMASLDFLAELGAKFPDEIGECLPDIIPAVSNCMHDTKQEVSNHAVDTMSKLCKVVGNPDIEPHVTLLVDCMAHPDHVSKTVQTISATTFVAEVTGPALSLMVPLLVRALNDRSASVMRPICVIADNLFKLVRNPLDAGQFMSQLLPGLDRIIETAAFPEIRALATAARRTLVNAAGGEDREANQVGVDEIMKQISKFFTVKKLFLLGFHNFSKEYSAIVMAHMMKQGVYRLNKWKEILTPLLSPLGTAEIVEELVLCLHGHFESLHKSTQDFGDDDDESEGKLLCDCEFSLAYGGMMLLNNTYLRLRKGQRYGLCGRNGSGKTTLMRAISKGQVEGFPSQSQLKCAFVEHKLQGEDAGLSVIDFLKTDEDLATVGKKEISRILAELGFDDALQIQAIGSLSGGWKMKLELARAMLVKADILLLDEPTNHLDVENIAWLENYLLTHPEITSLIVSHDSSFLDNVCTAIIHYESRKLVYYKGNLSKYFCTYVDLLSDDQKPSHTIL